MTNHLHKVFAIFAVLVFALNIFYASYVWVDFKLNQEFIANNLCVEKDIEESTCEGNCHLKKELQKVEENKGNSQQDPINVTESRLDILFFNNVEGYIVYLNSSKESYISYKCERDIQSGYLLPIFHPPIIS